MPTKKPSGGGARASARIRAEQLEARGSDYRATEIAEYRNLGERPDPSDPEALRWLAAVAFRAVEGAATDPGLTPEASREQLVRLIPQAVKAADPARLGARIASLEQALEELKHHAPDEPSGKADGARIGASLS